MCYGAIFWARIAQVVYAADRNAAAAAGFDDGVLWDDVARTPTKRRLVMRHPPSPEAGELFTRWLAMAGLPTKRGLLLCTGVLKLEYRSSFKAPDTQIVERYVGLLKRVDFGCDADFAVRGPR